MTQIDARIVEVAKLDPDLDALLRDHLAENEGEFLSTVFLADVARWAADPASSPAAAKGVCSLLEAAFTDGDALAKDIIGTGFVESLPAIDEAGGSVLSLLGPALRSVADEMGLTRPWR